MATSDASKRPSERLIGARIRVATEHADQAAAMFDAAGFQPIYVEWSTERGPSFWFSKMSDSDLARLTDTLPQEYYALRATVVSDVPPLSSR